MSLHAVARRSVALLVVTALLLPTGAVASSRPAPSTTAAVARVTQADGPTEDCPHDASVSIKQVADDLLIDRYHLGSHPVATLPHDLAWNEDPFGDVNWRERQHMLRYVMALVYQWRKTSADRYLDRALELVRSWLDHNPISAPASPFAWNDQATAWRTMTLVCMARIVPATAWLDVAIALHGERLADKRYYSGTGNHGLNQSIGLVDAGCYLDRSDWQALAVKRIDRMRVQVIDTQGVSNEQAVRYDLYDYRQFELARKHLTMCGRDAPADLERVGRIPSFLAYATRPDGYYETIGDTAGYRAQSIPGTPSEFSATAGRRGQRPAHLVRFYERGYAFGRTGWGDERPFADETFFSARYGPGMSHHGHDDSGAVTLYGYGSPLLVDPGYGDFNASVWRAYFRSRRAHNAVVADGLTSATGRPATLERSALSERAAELRVRIGVYPSVTMRRRIVFSRELGYLIVEDTMHSATARRYRQLWHLLPDAQPTTDGLRTVSHRDRGNVLIRQLLAGGTTRIVTGSTDPRQGWYSAKYGDHRPTPVVKYRQSGTNVRFITLLVPFASGSPDVTVSGLTVTTSGFSLTVDVRGQRERVLATSGGVRITDAP